MFGRASGFRTVVGGRSVVDLTSLAPSDGFIVQGDATNDVQGLTVRQTFDLTSLAPSAGFVIRGDSEYDHAGYSVSVGDVNGDGFADLIVGAPGDDDGGNDAGAAFVVFGSASGFGTAVGGRSVIDVANLAPSAGFVIQGDVSGDEAGRSVSSAGEAYVLFGDASGFGTMVGSRAVVDFSTRRRRTVSSCAATMRPTRPATASRPAATRTVTALAT